jgi:hypothetical protein
MKSSIRLLVFFLLSVAVHSCGNKGSKQQQQAPPPTAVNVVVVQPSPAVYYDQYPWYL